MWTLNYYASVTEGVFSERNVIYITTTGIQAKTNRRLSQHLTRL